MKVNVFVEQPGEPNSKNLFDKTTGAFIKTVEFDLTYPYPYGRVLETLSADGDEVDCYILTDKKFEVSSIIECDVIGIVEWFEDNQEDHKILAVPLGEPYEISDEVKEKITYFANTFFADQQNKNYRLGEFRGKAPAEVLITRSQEAYRSKPAYWASNNKR